MHSIIDKFKFESRGGKRCSNSMYHPYKTTCCNVCCIEDDELSDLYWDANDLTKHISLLQSPESLILSCPLCGAAEWGLQEVLSLSDVDYPWRWACYEE